MRETIQYLIHTLNLLAAHIHVQDKIFHEVKIYSGPRALLFPWLLLILCAGVYARGVCCSFEHLEESVVPLLNFLSGCNKGKTGPLLSAWVVLGRHADFTATICSPFCILTIEEAGKTHQLCPYKPQRRHVSCRHVRYRQS